MTWVLNNTKKNILVPTLLSKYGSFRMIYMIDRCQFPKVQICSSTIIQSNNLIEKLRDLGHK